MKKSGGHGFSTRLALNTALGIASAMALPADAWAQNVTDVPREEVVVTATKHGDSLVQDVPLAMTAYGADQLQVLNFQSLQSLSYTIPNVQFEDIGTGPGIANFSIRGLGINSSIPSVDPTVGVFVDGMYYGINAGIVIDNFDLEAVEVLRGPQGTLYGHNVTGGAVLIRTSQPSDEFNLTGRLGVETGPEYVADAVVTGPIVAGLLSGKLAIYHSEDEGWYTNDFDGSQFGASQMDIYRAAVRLTPSDDFEAILRLEHGNTDGDGPASQNHGLFSRDSFDFSVNYRGFERSDWEQAIFEINWEVPFGEGTVTNVFGWREYDSRFGSDIDATGTTPAPATAAGGTAFNGRVLTKQDQWSDELRYAGTFGPVDVITGLYWFTQNLRYVEERFLFAAFLGPGLTNPFRITRVGGGDGEFSTFGARLNGPLETRSAQRTYEAGGAGGSMRPEPGRR